MNTWRGLTVADCTAALPAPRNALVTVRLFSLPWSWPSAPTPSTPAGDMRPVTLGIYKDIGSNNQERSAPWPPPFPPPSCWSPPSGASPPVSPRALPRTGHIRGSQLAGWQSQSDGTKDCP